MDDPNLSTEPKKYRGDYAENWNHISYKYLIHSAEHYIVFIDKEGDIDWESSPEYDAKGHSDLQKHNAIKNDAALLEVTPCDGLRTDMKLHFKRLIAEGIVRSFEHDYGNAAKMIEAAEAYIVARGQETSRLWYLSSSFGMTVPFIVFAAAVWVWRQAVTQMLGSIAMWLCMAAAAGAVGALLSVIGRTGKLNFDCAAGRLLHYLEGASRIWAGAISGIIVGLAIKTEVVLAPLARDNKLSAVIILGGLAAGAAERLATSIISTISTSGTELPNSSIGHTRKKVT